MQKRVAIKLKDIWILREAWIPTQIGNTHVKDK